MSYCPKCGRQILDESVGCPICNGGDGTNRTAPMPEQTEKAEQVDSFTVEDGSGNAHHFETNGETGHAEYKKKASIEADATIHPVLKVLIIALIVLVGGFGAVAGIVAGIVLSKSPAEDYRRFGKLMMTVGIVMLALSLLCCVSAGIMGGISNVMYYY